MQEHVISKLVEDFERGRISRRQLIQNLTLCALGAAIDGVTVAAAAENKGLQALAVDHISYQVTDYAKTRDFYVTLLGLKVAGDTGTQCRLSLNRSNTYVLARNASSGVTPPRIDHIAYTIDGWDTNKSWFFEPQRTMKEADDRRIENAGVTCFFLRNGVRAKLQHLGLDPQPTRHGSFEAHPSFYVKDPDGFDVQISASGTTG